MLQAIPTPTHMAIVELERKEILKFLISQNVDGLHRKSGIDPTKLAELHGNTNLENCTNCKKSYLRDFDTCSNSPYNDHKTGRKCGICTAALVDSIINFDEQLPKKALEDGFEHSEEADLHLVLGSSLRVTPAADMPERTHEKGGKLVICNLQKTPLDSICKLRIFAKSDDLMKLVIEELQLEIPPFILCRRIQITTDINSVISIQGIDVDGTPLTFFKRVKIENKKAEFDKLNTFSLKVENVEKVKINLYFMGHYLEPNLEIDYTISDQPIIYELNYDPRYRFWNTKTI